MGTLQAVRKLDAAYAGMVHPQRGPALRAALEAALGRLVELRAAVEAGTLAAALAATAAGASPVGGPKAEGAKTGGPKAGGAKAAASSAQAQPTAVPALTAALQELNLTPQELEIPVPTYLVAMRAQVCAVPREPSTHAPTDSLLLICLRLSILQLSP